MHFLRSLFHFLGGLPLAIFLIASAALMVIAGTFLESSSDSHRFAASITYGSPLFTLLLCGFFINILFSSLRRWPFQKKHIPFLITHLGLLMVLAGAVIKIVYGVQGHMLVMEGNGSARITLPNSETLLVEKRHPSLPSITLETLRREPHGNEVRRSWIAEEQLHINGLAPIPVSPFGNRVRFDEEHEFDLIAMQTDDWESSAKEVYKQVLENKEMRPAFVWIKDKSNIIHFFSFDPWGEIYGTEIKPDELDTLVVYDKGFGGYTVPLEVPVGHTAETEIPPIQLFVRACQAQALNPQKELDSFFHTKPLPESTSKVINSLDWNLIPKEDYRGCRWAALLSDRIEEGMKEGFTFQEVIQMGNWPLKAENQRDLLRQIFTIAPQLPTPPPSQADNEKLLSVYMKLYGVIPQKTMTLESPLMIRHESAEPLRKWEDNRPLITVKAGKETFTLLFDPTGQGLKKTILNGRYLVRYQPDSRAIPHRLRLRQARQINYPGTTQPYSYEADILINQEPVTLSMNNVHETPDGYRFYLASISPGDPGAVKRVQIVVNYDPVKYLLTYPGAIILVLGIILLFTPNRQSLFR